MADLSAVVGMREPYNISLYPGTGGADGKRGDHIIIAPAYISTDADIEKVVDITTAVIKQFFGRDHFLDEVVAVRRDA